MKNKTAAILCVLWLLVMVGIAASTGTLLLSGKSSDDRRWVSSDEYQLIERYSRLDSVRKELTDNYYLEVDDEKLITGAIKGMMDSLDDPYTFYYTPDEMAVHNQETGGEYRGLGILIQNNDVGRIEILRVYKDSPAEEAGLKVGDCILKINDIRVYGTSAQTMDAAVSLMKGLDGTPVRMEILRGSEIKTFVPVCGDVSINNVSWTMMEDQIGYISIFQFSGDAVSGFESALNDLKAEGAQGLILDLRNNPGGILDDVVAIADHLLPTGNIVYIEDRAGSRTDYYSDEKYWDVPLVVLVNDMSASASEILAASVQDFERGTIVGMNTYGKGIVQTVINFEDAGDGMQYTSASYFTPKGRSIHGVGVAPDVVSKNENGYNAYSGEPDPENDSQLNDAIKILKSEMV